MFNNFYIFVFIVLRLIKNREKINKYPNRPSRSFLLPFSKEEGTVIALPKQNPFRSDSLRFSAGMLAEAHCSVVTSKAFQVDLWPPHFAQLLD